MLSTILNTYFLKQNKILVKLLNTSRCDKVSFNNQLLSLSVRHINDTKWVEKLNYDNVFSCLDTTHECDNRKIVIPTVKMTWFCKQIRVKTDWIIVAVWEGRLYRQHLKQRIDVTIRH